MRKHLAFVGIVFAVVLLDQLTKFLVRSYSPEAGLGPFRIIFVRNTGAAFGLLPNSAIILAAVGALVLGAIFYLYRQIPDELTAVASAALITGGTIGNIIDRILLGYVTDFISLWIWPAFNIADSALTLGAGLLLLHLLRDQHKN